MAMGFGLLICRAGIATSPSRTVELMGGVTGDSILHGNWPQKLLKTFQGEWFSAPRLSLVQDTLCPVSSPMSSDGGLSG